MAASKKRSSTASRLKRSAASEQDPIAANTYHTVVEEIVRRSGLTAGYVGDPVRDFELLERNLGRMRRLLGALGEPQNALRIVHVAGSKGKATTATHVANILTAAGYRAGLFVSPHLHSWRERIAVDGQLITPADFASVADDVLAAARSIEQQNPDGGTVNAFEILVAMALCYSRSRGCHAAVLEVGLGGRFDSTNVVMPEVSVITELELEHTAILGPTIREIAWNKGGIIKPGVPAVSLAQEAEATMVLDQIATEQNSRLLLEEREWHWKARSDDIAVQLGPRLVEGITPAAPSIHAQRNAALAAVTVLALPDMTISDNAIRTGIAQTQLAGHFEIIQSNGGGWLFDVAHTPKSMRLLIESFHRAGIVKPRVVAGFLQDKEIETMVEALCAVASEVILVPVRSPRSATIERLATAATACSGHARVRETLENALFPADSQQKAAQWTVITGSSALVAEARERLGLAIRY